jgi:microcystin-dependent protein
MAEPFIGEIRIWANNFAPRNWAFANGQLLPIAQNTALFSIYGTIYGGDGRTTFGLPNLQDRAPMHEGTGPGLSPRSLGQSGGTSTITLTEAQMPAHSHAAHGAKAPAVGDNDDPSTASWFAQFSGANGDGYGAPGTLANMAPEICALTGGNQSHQNMQPFQVLQMCVALVGLYPTRDFQSSNKKGRPQKSKSERN